LRWRATRRSTRVLASSRRIWKRSCCPAPSSTRYIVLLDQDIDLSAFEGRFATVEPVFANLRYNKKLIRFTLLMGYLPQKIYEKIRGPQR
jgi:hypothetical protein